MNCHSHLLAWTGSLSRSDSCTDLNYLLQNVLFMTTPVYCSSDCNANLLQLGQMQQQSGVLA